MFDMKKRKPFVNIFKCSYIAKGRALVKYYYEINMNRCYSLDGS